MLGSLSKVTQLGDGRSGACIQACLITKGHALDHLNKQHAHFADENLVHSGSKARSGQRCRQERRLQRQLEPDVSLGAATYKMPGLGRVAESLSPGV